MTSWHRKRFFHCFWFRRTRTVFFSPRIWPDSVNFRWLQRQHALMALDLLNKRMSTEETGGTPRMCKGCYRHVSYFTRSLIWSDGDFSFSLCHGRKVALYIIIPIWLHGHSTIRDLYTHEVWIPTMGMIPVGCIKIPHINGLDAGLTGELCWIVHKNSHISRTFTPQESLDTAR